MILLLLFALPDRNNASAATRLSNYLSSVAAAKHLDLPCWHRERAMPPFLSGWVDSPRRRSTDLTPLSPSSGKARSMTKQPWGSSLPIRPRVASRSQVYREACFFAFLTTTIFDK